MHYLRRNGQYSRIDKVSGSRKTVFEFGRDQTFEVLIPGVSLEAYYDIENKVNISYKSDVDQEGNSRS